MPTVDGIATRIQREGEPMVLQRVGQLDLPVTGVVRGYRAEELVGNVIQGDRELRISGQDIAAGNWPGPPKRGDRMLIRGKVVGVESCETRTLRGADAMHIIQVRGG